MKFSLRSLLFLTAVVAVALAVYARQWNVVYAAFSGCPIVVTPGGVNHALPEGSTIRIAYGGTCGEAGRVIRLDNGELRLTAVQYALFGQIIEDRVLGCVHAVQVGSAEFGVFQCPQTGYSTPVFRNHDRSCAGWSALKRLAYYNNRREETMPPVLRQMAGRSTAGGHPIYAWDVGLNDIGPFPPGSRILHKGKLVATVTSEGVVYESVPGPAVCSLSFRDIQKGVIELPCITVEQGVLMCDGLEGDAAIRHLCDAVVESEQ